jgi:hypothetical protein
VNLIYLIEKLRHAATATASGYEVVEPVDLAKVVGTQAEALGLRQGPNRRVYRVDGPVPEEFPEDRFTAWVRKAAIWACETYLQSVNTGHSANLARTTLYVLARPELSERYVRRLRSRVIDWLSDLDERQIREVRLSKAAGRKAGGHQERRSGRTVTRESEAQRKAEERRRNRHAEMMTAAWWLRHLYLADEETRPEPGTRIPTADLARRAREEIQDLLAEYDGDWDWFREDFPEAPERLRVPGSRHFHAVAEAVLPRRRTARTTVYIVPEEERLMDGLSKLDALLLEKAVERIVERWETRVTRALAKRESGSIAATGTDGAVVDLMSERSRRRRVR